MEIQVSFNRDAQLWKVGPQVGDRVMAKRVVLDAPAKSNGGILVVRDCTLEAEGVTRVGNRTAVDVCRITRKDALPGTPPKHDPQLEWCVLYDPNTRKWYSYREDKQKVVVSTTNLEMDCHAITSNGVWHCHAEQIVNGRTNIDKAVHEAIWVKLRTLLVYDQKIEVEIIGIGAKIKV